MVAEIDYNKCKLCGTYSEAICVDRCPTSAMALRNNKIEVTEFLCEDCNECAYVCPDKAIKIKVVTW